MNKKYKINQNKEKNKNKLNKVKKIVFKNKNR